MARPATAWTLTLDLQLIATIREHVVRGGDEWRSAEHGDVPWKRLFARTRAAWPAHWTKRELAKRWTDAYRRWLPAPAGNTGRAQRVDLVELEALVRRHHGAASRKREAAEEEEGAPLKVARRRPSLNVENVKDHDDAAALLSAPEAAYVARWLPLLADANKQAHRQCRLQVGPHELDLDWLLRLLAEGDEGDGDVPQAATAEEARAYLALAGTIAPQAQLAVASGVRVVLASGSEFIIPAPATNAPLPKPTTTEVALPATSSQRQMLLAGLYVAISGAPPPLTAWPTGLAAFIWWHVLSHPSVSLVLPPPPLPLPFASLVQVVDSLGLRTRQWWVAQSLAVLPLESTMECLADMYASERQLVLLSLCEGCTSSTMCTWRKRSTPLTLIAERGRQRFGEVLTLTASDSSTVTVTCPSPRSMARFCVDDVPCDVAPQRLPRLPRRIEFCVDGLTVAIELNRNRDTSTADLHRSPPLLQLASPLQPETTTPPPPPTPAQPPRSPDATAVAASALVCLETLCDDAEEPPAAAAAPIPSETLPALNSQEQQPRLSVQSDEKHHRRLVRELLLRIEAKLAEKLLRELWSAACAPDSNLGVAAVGPSPQKQTLRSAVSVLLAMGLNSASQFLDIGSGHGLLPITAALLFGVGRATGVEVERQKFEWSRRALPRLPQHEQAALSFHHIDVCEWQDLREHTHVHAFDYDFPPDVLRHVGWALRRSPCWQVFASCSDQRDWLRLWQSSARYCDREMEHWWATNVVPFDKVRVSLCGSHARHTLYLFQSGA